MSFSSSPSSNYISLNRQGLTHDGDEEKDTADDGVFEVRTIHDSRLVGQEYDVMVLIEWVSYPRRSDWTWEPVSENHYECKEVIEDYCKTLFSCAPPCA